MARFHVYRLENELVIDVQANVLDRLRTRVVVPLVASNSVGSAAARLNPHFKIDGVPYIMMSEFVATVPVGELGEEVDDLSLSADAITAAMDFLFQGF